MKFLFGPALGIPLALLLLSGTVHASCGDGYVDYFEDCDAGGISTGDCDGDCTFVSCGDGFVNAVAGEKCDPLNDPTCNEQCRSRYCGDPSGDGAVHAADALQVLRSAVGSDWCPRFRCDADGDNKVTTSDALRVLRVAVRLPVELSCSPVARRLLSFDQEKLVAVFANDDFAWVVETQRVRKITLDGVIVDQYVAPRPIHSATFDGNILVLADGAKWIALYPESLEVLSSALVIETCESMVIVSGDRLVCGPGDDWDRVFYTYDLFDGSLLKESSGFYTYNGIPMKRLPGQDAFVTVSGGSPSDFHLYTVDESGFVAHVHDSPYHGDFAVTETYTFDGDAAENVITQDGLVLHIDPVSCTASQANCFKKNGQLGALESPLSYVGLDHVGNTAVGLASGSQWYEHNVCAKGCTIHAVDVPSRDILSQHDVVIADIDRVSWLVAVRSGEAAVVAGSLSETTYGVPVGYAVYLLEMD